LLALSILGLLIVAAYLIIVAPVLDLYSRRNATLADRQSLLPRLSVAAEQLPALRAALAEANTAASTRKIALDGSSDAIAAASLQSHLEELAAAAGVEVGSSEGRAPENRGAYRRIGLRLAVSGEYEAIVKLLSAIETAAPPLILTNLQLHAALRPRGEAASASIDAAFEVFGFRRTDTSVAAKQ
jgi:general secretion pathway protein M